MSKLGISIILVGILFVISGYGVFNSDVIWKDKATLTLIAASVVFFILGGFAFWNDKGSSDV